MNYHIEIPSQSNKETNVSGLGLFRPEKDLNLRLTFDTSGSASVNGKPIQSQVLDFYSDTCKNHVINDYLEEAERLKKKRPAASQLQGEAPSKIQKRE